MIKVYRIQKISRKEKYDDYTCQTRYYCRPYQAGGYIPDFNTMEEAEEYLRSNEYLDRSLDYTIIPIYSY